MHLPESYIVSKFYQFSGAPKYNRCAKTYQASCPICREGKSWLKKKRLYYIPDEYRIFCHNCGWSGTPYAWIKQVSGLTYREIIDDSLNYDTVDINAKEVKAAAKTPTLPGDCINLYDAAQSNFYKDNEVVQKALNYINGRRLDVAINRPSSLYLCFDSGGVHDKRIIIPFFDSSNKIIFYQSRAFLPEDHKPKYLSKSQSERSLFNINKVDAANPIVYAFEGPLNAFFTKNSIAVGGIQENSMQLYSSKQAEQIEMLCKFTDIVWVLDSQWIDSASYNKTLKLIEMNQKVFIWPELLGKRFKDFNDICTSLMKDEITAEFIGKNTYEGLAARIKYAAIKLSK